jgi:hypothetical protein
MFWKRNRSALRAGLGRHSVTRAQARRDREWRRFVRELTDPARQLSPAEDERMRDFLERHSVEELTDRSESPARRAA